MRLIDADKLLELMKDQKEREIWTYAKGINAGLNIVKSIINDETQTPTAYDVDKVVEQLKTDSSVRLYGSGNSNNYLIPLEKAIEIVKAGVNMKIDEAIEHAREKAKEQRYYANFEHNGMMYQSCIKCAEEHEQLAEWLEELKDCRDKNKMVVRVDVENMDSIKDKIEELSKYAEIQYEKAIDDFVESVKNLIAGSSVIRFKDIDEIAEQLKAGGSIELSEHSESQGNRTGK